MAYGTVNAEQMTTQSGFTLGAGNSSSFKNRLINGGMVIDQRNAGASVTQITTPLYTVDRFYIQGSVTSKFTAQQSTTAPVGFMNSLKITSSSAYTVGTSEFFVVGQVIEGFNIADLNWGTANAKTVTLSFQVYSSLTGTFGGVLQNNAQNRSYPFSYTISSANTWTTISVTVAGDTTGTWSTDNSAGIRVYFGLGVGSTYSGTAGSWAGSLYLSATGATSVVGTNGATFFITGVQLEVGTVATSFDYRSYGTELALCQRYYEKSYDIGTVPATATGTGAFVNGGLYSVTTTNYISAYLFFKVSKRATPTMLTWDTSGNAGKGTRDNFGVGSQSNITATTQNIGQNGTQVYLEAGNAATGIQIQWTASAEL